MIYPNMDSETWYNLRDDRPERIEGVDTRLTRNKRIGVIADEQDLINEEVQIMASVSINMLARFCRNITISFPDCLVNLPNLKTSKEFNEYTLDEINKIDPYGNFNMTQTIDVEDFDCVLVIGNNIKLLGDNVFHINCTGWLAYYSFGGSNENIDERKSNNPIGAIFSACLGVSVMYSYSLNREISKFKMWYSTFDFNKAYSHDKLSNPDIDQQFNFGRIHQIGCGAVGSSVIKFLSYTKWKGEFHLIDYDNVDIPNLCSSLSFTADDANNKIKKVASCYHTLENRSQLMAVPYDNNGGYDSFISEGFNVKYPPDIILCLANENNVWESLQQNYPPLVFHATTTSNWGINYGSHTPIEEWCIMCRFYKDIKSDHIPTCSESIIDVSNSGEVIYGVLPFLSPTSAAMVLAGLGRLTLSDDKFEENSVNLSFRTSPLNYIIKSIKKPDMECPVCSSQKIEIYPKDRVKSKYWNLKN